MELSPNHKRTVAAFALGAALWFWWVYMRPRWGGSHKAPVNQTSRLDHAPGNAIPEKTIQPFKKVADYMFSPWDPTNNAEKIEFLDAENMPRTDYILPGGNRLVTHGFTHHVKTSQPPYVTYGMHRGKVMQAQKEIFATTTRKNLNHHTSIWHGQH